MKHQAEVRRAETCCFRHGSRAVAALLVAAALVWTVAACGSGAVEGPDDEASSDGGGGDNGGGDNGGGDNGGGDNGGGDNGGGDNGGSDNGGGGNGSGGNEFSWKLPGGDLSLDEFSEVFNRLAHGKCGDVPESAEDALADFLVPPGQLPPGREELFKAAIAACNGDLAEARRHLDAATVSTEKGDCRLDEAIRSVLEQRPNRPKARCPASDFESDPDSGFDEVPSSTESTTTSTTDSDDSTTESATTSTSSPASTDAGGSTSTVGGGTDTAG